MTRLRSGQQIELAVDDLAYGGLGVGRLSGLVVMVAGGVPGDRVVARVTRMKRSLAEARVEEVLDPSPLRVEPFCRHNAICGGCKIQEIDYPEQVRLKGNQVLEALRRIGGFAEPPVEAPIPSPVTRYYRNKMEYSFGLDPEGGLEVGLHPAGDFRRVFQIEECHLLSARSNEIVGWVTAAARASGLPPYDQRRHEGFFRFLTVREGKATGEAMVILTTNAGDDAARAALREMASGLVARFPEVRSVVRQVHEGRAGIAAGEQEEVLAGKRTIEEHLGGFRFEISARSFFQTNTLQAEALFSRVLDDAALSGDGVALDLFCGTGAISLLLSRRARRVYGVESSPDAVSDAIRNAALNGVDRCEFVQGEVREVLERTAIAQVHPEVAIVNPPRAGVHPAVVKRLLRMPLPRIVYVSCNPTTLARDLAALVEGGFRLCRVVPVDMFPHTAHVESVALLDRPDGAR
jgi:23S rRNA (uracil1939-C5)-methyltransferase